MTNCRKWLLYVIILLTITMFLGCQGTNNLVDDSDIVMTENSYDESENISPNGVDEIVDEAIPEELAFIGSLTIPAFNFEDANLDNFISNPMFSVQENIEFKRVIIESILYMHDFYIDFNNILLMVDEERSKEWFAHISDFWIAQYPEEGRGSWTVVDEIRRIKNHNRNQRELRSIQANFMMRSQFTRDDLLNISVPIWQTCMISGQESGYLIYYFDFEKIDSRYRLIRFSIGA